VSDIQTTLTDHVLTVTLDRAPVNALTGDMMREITEVFRSVESGWDTRVVLLNATPGRAFCGGVDLGDSARRHAAQGSDVPPVDLLDSGRVVRDCFEAVLDCPVPVVAAVGGAAVGAGLALLACVDIIIASEKARFALPEINAGVLGGARPLQRLVGNFKARSMFFTGDFASAADFFRLGAVEEVVSVDELPERAAAWAAKLAGKSPIGLRLAKESLSRVEHLPLMEGYRLEQDYTARMTRFEDSAEARKSYLEKRSPEWKLH
jgi:enoyl-CoA hydratase